MDRAYGYVQGEVNLTCEAVAEPAATFTWTKDGEIKGPSEGVHIYNEQHKSVLQVHLGIIFLLLIIIFLLSKVFIQIFFIILIFSNS